MSENENENLSQRFVILITDTLRVPTCIYTSHNNIVYLKMYNKL